MQNPAYDCTMSRYTIITKTKHQGFKSALAPRCLCEFSLHEAAPPAEFKGTVRCLGLHFCVSKAAPW